MEKRKIQKSKPRKIIEGVVTGVFLAIIAFASTIMIVGVVEKKQTGNNYAPTKFGDAYMPVVVLTDSMEPDYEVDSAIFIKKVSCEKIIESFNNKEKVDLAFDDTYYPGVSISQTYSEETKTFLQNYGLEDGAPKINRTTETTPAPIRTLTHRMFHYEITDKEYGEGKYRFFVEGINRNSKSLGNQTQYQVFTENELYGRVTGTSKFVGGLFTFITKPIGLIILLLIPTLYMIISSFIDIFKKEEAKEETVLETINDSKANTEDPLSKLSSKEQERLKKELLDELLGKDEEDEK